jgi:hypothetical protein
MTETRKLRPSFEFGFDFNDFLPGQAIPCQMSACSVEGLQSCQSPIGQVLPFFLERLIGGRGLAAPPVYIWGGLL